MPLVIVIKIYLVIALLLHYNYSITTLLPDIISSPVRLLSTKNKQSHEQA